jgi:Protein of unknown function (DUF3347)
MKSIILLFASIILSLTAFSGGDKHGHDHGSHDHGSSKKAERYIKSTTKKNKATNSIVDGYLKIKNALVTDDQKGAAKGGKTLLKAFAKFDKSKLSKEQKEEYLEIIENAKEQAEHITKNPIDHQREHFEVLSEDINDLIALVGTSKTLYKDFCPMASGGKGAFWLSEYENIKNPFFGKKMPKCGKIQKQIN